MVAPGVDIGEIILMGVGGTLGIAFVAILAQVGLSYLAQRNLNDQLSIGLQGVVGTNNLQIVDAQQDDTRQNGGKTTVQNNGNSGDGQ